jgi:hypothetical protein
MRTCSYCGAEYPDDVLQCPVDHTSLVAESAAPASASPAASDPQRPLYEFTPLPPEDRQKDFVTLLRCGTLVSADMVVSRLRAAGIEAFIPDECLMQTIGFNLNTFGYVRVQTTPNDYERAKALLGGPE